jgi:D-glycero-D-manno-heptose 1,7-bisphosphate phosphatase
MLLQARREWPLDWNRSFLIGDKESDMQAAAAASLPGYRFGGGDLYDFLISQVLR